MKRGGLVQELICLYNCMMSFASLKEISQLLVEMPILCPFQTSNLIMLFGVSSWNRRFYHSLAFHKIWRHFPVHEDGPMFETVWKCFRNCAHVVWKFLWYLFQMLCLFKNNVIFSLSTLSLTEKPCTWRLTGGTTNHMNHNPLQFTRTKRMIPYLVESNTVSL